jgi:hypothetical protein
MEKRGSVRIARKKALSMDELVRMYIDSMRLSPALNTRRIFAAWDEASGAGPYTLKRFFSDGRLYITLSSSVVRNQLSFQSQALVEKMNAILSKDELFARDDARVSFVKELILK